MDQSEQVWLSISGLCDRLRLTPGQVRTLVKKGCFATIGKFGTPGFRVLDPTPEYRDQLRVGAMIHQKAFPIPGDLHEKALLTAGECAELLGMTYRRWNKYIRIHRPQPAIRVDKTHFLYSPMTVRDIMLKRSKRTLSKQKCSFLISELIELFRGRLADEVSLIPTDKEFAADERLQLRLSKIVTEAQKADFAQKVKLAQEVVQLLEQVKGAN